jgi:nucleoside-diphosphate-sugar epimerase
VRRARRPSQADGIGVTGASTPLGAALLLRLAGRAEGPRLIGLDAEPAVPRGVEARRCDVLAPGLAAHLSGLRTVVHLALSYDPAADPHARRARTVSGTRAVLEAAREAGAARVVLVTSLDVHASPTPGAALPLPEDAPLRAEPDRPLTGDLLEVERLADHATRTGLDVLVLRPAALVAGPLGPDYDGALLRSLAARGCSRSAAWSRSGSCATPTTCSARWRSPPRATCAASRPWRAPAG